MADINTLFKLLDGKTLDEVIILKADKVIAAAHNAFDSGIGREGALAFLDQQVAELRNLVRSVSYKFSDWPENWGWEKAFRCGAELHGLRAELLAALGRPDESAEAMLAAAAYSPDPSNFRMQILSAARLLPPPVPPPVLPVSTEDTYQIYMSELKGFGVDEDLAIIGLKEDATNIPSFVFQHFPVPTEYVEAAFLGGQGFSKEIAATALRKTIDVLRPHGPSRLYAESLICFSRILSKAADVEDRFVYILEAIEALNALQTKIGMGRAILELGAVLEDKDLFADALRAYELAIPLLIASGEIGAVALACYRQAVMARKMGMPTIAIRLLKRSELTYGLIPARKDFEMQLHTEFVHNYLLLELPEQAMHYIDLILEQNPEHFFPYLRRAQIHHGMGDLAAALDDYKKAIIKYVILESRTKSDQFSGASRIYEDEVFLEVIWFCCHNGFTEDALEVLLLSHAGNLHNISREGRKKKISTKIKEKAAALALKSFQVLQENGSMEIYHRDAQFLVTEADILTQAGTNEIPASIASLKIVETIRKKLGKNSCLIETAYFKDEVWLFYLSRDHFECRLSGMNRQQWEALRNSFDETDQVYDHFDPLVKDIMAPFSEHKKDIKKLVFSVNPLIYGIPFHALIWNRKYLAETFKIGYITNTWDLLTDDPDEETVVQGPGIAVFAECPSLPYDNRYGEIDTRTEKEKFMELFPVHKETQTASEVLYLANSPLEILHFACHGEYEPDRPLFSRLMLYDRPLFAFEIILSGIHPKIVFINACDTANGKMKAGGYIENIAAAFLRSGARYVIASLWPVADFSAEFFMGSFYKSLRDGLSPDESLNKAQRAMIAVDAYAEPFIWAPYIMYSGEEI